MEPNIIAYGALNRSCEKSGRWQWQPVAAVLSEILVGKLDPSIITYGAVDSAREKSRRLQW
eukprot:5034371-Pyramimonas_sp.AAC.1